MQVYEFEWPVRWVVGPDSLDALGAELRRLGAQKPLLISDEGLSKIGLFEKVLKVLRVSYPQAQSFDRIPLESEAQVLQELYDFCEAQKIDAIVSLGGGSVLDSGKALALMLGYGERDPSNLESFEYFRERRFIHVCLPTTSGTGSEAGHGAVIKKGNKKLLIAGAALYPHVALLDPALTQSLPPRITVATAMDAWVHSWEALTGKQKNPLSTAIARWTLQTIPERLDVVLDHPHDLRARQDLAEAACLAGLSFTHSMVGLAHALAHALVYWKNIPHGEAVALFLPLSLECSVQSGETFEELQAEMLLWKVTSPKELLDKVRRERNYFCKKVGIPLSLEELGFAQNELADLAQKALSDGTSLFAAGKLNQEGVLELLEKWYSRV
jgi:alcohol dehydrogenase